MVQLTTLELYQFGLQLQAQGGFTGLLGAACLPLKQLRLHDCVLLDCSGTVVQLAGWDQQGAAFSLLPDLQHLGLCNLYAQEGSSFGTNMLQHLQQLTYIEVVECEPVQARTVLQSLQPLTRLARLQLFVPNWHHSLEPGSPGSLIGAITLPSAQLTYLVLPHFFVCQPDVLAGKTMLQHLDLHHCYLRHDVERLLSELQQLTHLDLALGILIYGNDWYADNEGNQPTAAFSALTASSHLRHLQVDISRCRLPAGVWQHMFPAGRQLPFLQSLDIFNVQSAHPIESGGTPELSRLVRCCPGLRSLRMLHLKCGVEQLAALSELTGLSHTPCDCGFPS
jgi:hypothetical protein